MTAERTQSDARIDAFLASFLAGAPISAAELAAEDVASRACYHGVQGLLVEDPRFAGAAPAAHRALFRIAAADANPYVILSAALASGLWGIEHRVEPEAVVTGNAYDRKFPARLGLPRTLWDSAQRLKGSKAARDWFGDAFVEHFAATREWEEREFRKHISDWELARYFEII